MKNKTFFGIAGIFFLFAFFFFTILVKKDLFTGIDFNLTVKMQDKVPKRIDPVLEIFSFLARGEFVGVVLVIFLLLRKKIQNISVIFFFVVAHMIEFFGKKFVHQPTPPFLFYRAADLPLFRDYINPGFSYPSGHTLRAVFISVILLYVVYSSKKRTDLSKHAFLAIATLFILAVGLTKIILGQHWPTDIIGGGLLGLAFACFSLFLFH